MKKILMKAMTTSISEVMETMFYLPVEFGQKATLAQSGMDNKNTLACNLTFSGDVSGCLTMVVSRNLIAEMAENFMGEPREHLTEAHLSGTLTEMLNMVCGNALSKTESNVPFELEIPEIIEDSEMNKKDVFSIVETTGSKMAILLTLN
jgi:CheY-specific phosphatase CheX